MRGLHERCSAHQQTDKMISCIELLALARLYWLTGTLHPKIKNIIIFLLPVVVLFHLDYFL